MRMMTFFLLLAAVCSCAVAFAADVQSEKPLVVIMLGPPGSGKGTQAVRLAEKLNIPHISTGDLFRDNIRRDTELGKKAKSYIDAGKLSPDELVLDMLYDRVAQPDCAKGYLLDGFPRTIPQAESLDKHLGDTVRIVALNLQVSDEEVMKRLGGRLSCKECGQIYNINAKPPKEEGICDLCGGELYQRTDDTPEVISERLRVYREQTAPLINFYRNKGVLHDVNGERAPDAVQTDLIRHLSA